MEKIVVVSSNANPDYLFYAPFIVKAWHHWGWKVAIVLTHDVDVKAMEPNGADYIIQLPEIPGLRTETQAQGGRLYAANYLPEDSLVMTSDMDLLPLSDYWHPNPDNITVYGHDLTDYSYFPMGYIAMSCYKWKHVMKLSMNTERDFLRDAQETEIAFAPDWESWWNFDWDLITKRLKSFTPEYNITHVKRGRRENSPFAFGRIDRGDSMTMIPEPWIDAHAENNNVRHPDKLNKFLSIFESKYGKL